MDRVEVVACTATRTGAVHIPWRWCEQTRVAGRGGRKSWRDKFAYRAGGGAVAEVVEVVVCVVHKAGL